MTVKKICVIGLELSGVPLSAVIAVKCPEIRVAVVQTNPEVAFQWNSGRIPASVYIPGLDDLIRKCQNKNLFFTTNEKVSIKEADIIFILSESKLKTYGEGKNQVVNLSLIEEAAYLIAEHAESSKIVVETSSIPLKTAECVSNVLTHNSKPGIEYQVLSNPEFYEHGSSLQNFLFPECILIGCEDTPKGLAAAKQLASVYERWVTPQSIIIMKNWTVELSKICTSSMVALGLSSIYAMSAFCEEYGENMSSLFKLLEKDTNLKSVIREIPFNTGKFSFALRNLMYICESYNLSEVADYWRQTHEMFNFYKIRFFKQFIQTLNQTSWSNQIALLGFDCHKDTGMPENPLVVLLCKLFLEHNLMVNIYDPNVSKGDVINDIMSADCDVPKEDIKSLVTLFDDPYKAVYHSRIMIVCDTWPEFAQLDFKRIFVEMEKPAYIFEDALLLPHSELLRIGFKVNCIGK